MGKAMDFQKLRKKRQRMSTARRLLILLLLAVAVAAAVQVNNFLLDMGLSTSIRDMIESYGGSGFPVPTPGGILRDIKTLGGDLAVLNDTNLNLYNQKGKLIKSYQQMRDSTLLVCGGKRALTYDIGGRRLTMHARSRELHTREMEFGILCADMNELGDFAVATSSRQYVAQITVINRKYEECFWWYSSENFIAEVAISPSGNRMVAGCLNTQGGVLKTVLYLFDFGSEQELAKLELPDTLPLNLTYLPDGRFSLLTDKQYILYTANGEPEHVYEFGGRELVAMERSGSEALLLLRAQSGRSRVQQLVLLDKNSGEKAALSLDQKVRDMAVGSRGVYVLTSDGIRMYSHEFALQSEFLVPGISDIHLVDQRLYYFTQDEINVMPQQG